MDTKEDILLLIHSYLSGNANQADISRLEAWVLKSKENKDFFIESKRNWHLGALSKSGFKPDIDEDWKKLSDKLEFGAKVVNINSGRRKWSSLAIAASFAILIVAGLMIFNLQNQKQEMLLSMSEVVQDEMLPDGSRVVLNAGSNLDYSSSKKDKTRRLKLSGNAFFDVARFENRPFKIETDNIEVEVLGTSFYVDAPGGNELSVVSVESGVVAVSYGDQRIEIRKQQEVLFDPKTKELTKRQNNDQNHLFLLNKTLIFNEASLSEVIETIESYYEVDILISNPQLITCRITAVYKDKSIDALINILAASLALDYNKEGDNFTLIGESCN